MGSRHTSLWLLTWCTRHTSPAHVVAVVAVHREVPSRTKRRRRQRRGWQQHSMDQAPGKKRGHEKMPRLVFVANRGQDARTGTFCWVVLFLRRSCSVQYAQSIGLRLSFQGELLGRVLEYDSTACRRQGRRGRCLVTFVYCLVAVERKC